MNKKLSANEAIKEGSRALRGTLAEGLKDQLSGAIGADDQFIIKHHGIYMQDDRDRRDAREAGRLERAYSYMARLRIPGGDISAEQWLAIQNIVDSAGSGVVKITTRQTVQIHGVIKAKLKPTIQWFYQAGLDTIAACGDVNRNVASNSFAGAGALAEEAHGYAEKLSLHLLPQGRAWYEIWIDEEPLTQAEPSDPLYENRYLPRKFKIGIAVPPNNDTDVFTNDVALIAIGDETGLTGFNIAVGGGMGTTHGAADTYPRLASEIGYVAKDKVLDAVWQIAAVQRDCGNRQDRRLARLKYTVDRIGIAGFRAELEKRLGYALDAARPYRFEARGDVYDWVKGHDGRWSLTVFVENGRVVDADGYALKTALAALADTGKCRFRFTSNQNVMLTDVAQGDLATINALLSLHGIDNAGFSPARRNAMACVALSSCPLALAEGQRYLPKLMTEIEALLNKHGILDREVVIRMTGCPNGCARPFAAEIGFVGRSSGHYNLYLAGCALGLRLNRLYKENLTEPEILAVLDPLFADYAANGSEGERFGDFINRTWK